MLNECEQLWASRAAQALDTRLINHVVAPSVNPAIRTHGLALCIQSQSLSFFFFNDNLHKVYHLYSYKYFQFSNV